MKGGKILQGLAVTLPVSIILGIVSLKILDIIYQSQKVPFIDEIFHIPQAQLYCNNKWAEWNPKITTLPGLYLVSYFLLKPLQVFGYENFCSVYALRVTNVIATVVNFFLAFCIISHLDNKSHGRSKVYQKLLSAFNIAIFPPLYFFTFLYYTDVWSVTFVLLMYYSHLSNWKYSRVIGTFSSSMAVLMRQTNIIWVGFCTIIEIWTIISKNIKKTSNEDFTFTISVIGKFFSDYFNYRSKKSKSVVSLVGTVFSSIYHYLAVSFLFLIFLIFNGSVVLGDKTAHSVTLHPMQTLYFLDFAAFFGLPFVIFQVLPILKKPPNIFVCASLFGVCAVSSEYNKLEHPYLLADNRHLAFYVWKRLFGHPTFRRFLIPTYVFSAIAFWRILRNTRSFMFAVVLLFCIFLNLTPQYLFELRYFIIPYFIWRLQFKKHSVLFIETVFFVFINMSVIFLFLNKPFTWSSEPGIQQRFIW